MKDPTGRRLGERVAMRTPAQMVDAAGCITEIMLKDISSTGAQIETDPSTSIPRLFYLRVARRNINQQVELVWRNGTKAGVRFILADESKIPEVQIERPVVQQTRVSLADLRKLATKAR